MMSHVSQVVYLALTMLKYFCINRGRQMGFFNFKSSYMSYLGLSDSIECLGYGSTGIINSLILSVCGLSLRSTDVRF